MSVASCTQLTTLKFIFVETRKGNLQYHLPHSRVGVSDLHHHRETWGCNLKKNDNNDNNSCPRAEAAVTHWTGHQFFSPNFAHAFTPTDNLELPISLKCVSLDCGRKTECPERARDKATTPAAGHFCQRKMTPCSSTGIVPKTFSL